MTRGKKRFRQLKDLTAAEKAEIREVLLSNTVRGVEAMERYNISTYLFWQQLATELGIRYQKSPTGKRTDGSYVEASAEEIEQAKQQAKKLVVNQKTRKLRWVREQQANEAKPQASEQDDERVEQPEQDVVEEAPEGVTVEVVDQPVEVVEAAVEAAEDVVRDDTTEDDVVEETNVATPSERNLVSYRFAEEPLFDHNDMAAIMELLENAKQALRDANTRIEELVVERDVAINQKEANEADYLRMMTGYDQLARDLEVYKRSHTELMKIRNTEKLRQVNVSRNELSDLIARTQKFVEESKMIKVPTSDGADGQRDMEL